jgi:O-succinylbenzoic acid--CoA ligase
MSVVDLLSRASADSEAIALVTPYEAVTFAQLDDEVAAMVRLLRSAGSEPGQVVPVVLQPDRRGVVTLLALWRIGATPAPLNPRLTEAERARATSALRDVSGGAQAILWTSGTGGRPRGVAISFEALLASALGAKERLGLSERDVWLASLSPAHIGGLALITRSLLLGGSLFVVGPFNISRDWELLQGRGLPAGVAGLVTHLSLVPTQLLHLLDVSRDEPPPRWLRCVLVGGSGTPSRLLARAQAAGWPVALTYGLTEATSQVATAPPELTRRKPGTVGRPLAGVELRIDESEEILVRGSTLASAYVASADSLTDSDRWHHTGDIGRLDADGDVWVTGRRVDRIVSGGVTVDAVEVEEVLLSHPAVGDACVVGVTDDEWGEVVCAWIVPRLGVVELEALDAYVRSRLSASKLPRRYHVEKGIPRNINGKVDRAAVRAIIRRSS